MNNLEAFVQLHYENAIQLKEQFKAIEDKPWDSLTVFTELNVQIGHIFTVIKESQGLIEEGRAINNLGDEISDVLLQLSYLAHLEKVSFDDASKYDSDPYSEVEGLAILGGELGEALLEKNGYRFKKPRQGFDTIDDFIKNRIKRMMAIALKLGNKANLDLGLEFGLMCADATHFVSTKVG